MLNILYNHCKSKDKPCFRLLDIGGGQLRILEWRHSYRPARIEKHLDLTMVRL